jgi:hypothetical protein
MKRSTAHASVSAISWSRSRRSSTAPGTPSASSMKPVNVTVGFTRRTSKRPLTTVMASVPRMRARCAVIVMSVSASRHAAA